MAERPPTKRRKSSLAAILDAVAARQRAREQPETMDDHLEAEGERLLAEELSEEETDAIRRVAGLAAATKTEIQADMRAQAEFLAQAARGMGLQDADELALEKPDLLARLALRWRAQHPRSSMGSFAHNAAKRAIDVLLHGREKKPHLATPTELDRLRCNPSPRSVAEWREAARELRRRRQEEEAQLTALERKNGKKP